MEFKTYLKKENHEYFSLNERIRGLNYLEGEC